MAARKHFHDYGTEELRQKLFAGHGEPFVLVDTLPHETYEFRHLPGAINLPLELLEELAPETLLDREVEIITYCTGPG
jgi:rhodanese-related sulfurtransferase